MRSIGLNGFGRIGKCIFLQMLQSDAYCIKVINAPSIDVSKIEFYLKNDSVHKYSRDFKIEILNDVQFNINGHVVTILRNKDASKLDWNSHGVDFVIDATGAYLTQERVREHNVSKVIMTAPPKDDTPMFVYGANHTSYAGEKIVSGASCTTNCITPVLAFLNETYKIKQANFTTIHAATASQQVVDTANSKSRTSRSIFNNIIPHTTGASASIFKVLPGLAEKISGTSVRVPVNNVSLVDLNVDLDATTDITAIMKGMESCPYIHVCGENLVSSDYISTTCPSIVDKHACMKIGPNSFKIMIWYDNEWSYSAQITRMVDCMHTYSVEDKHYIDNVSFAGKNVVVRLDLNVPMQDNSVTSDYRIVSCLPTLKKILKDEPRRVVIMSHMGRPKGIVPALSMRVVLPILSRYLDEHVEFLEHGLSSETIDVLDRSSDRRIFLLENLRFHPEETDVKADVDGSKGRVLGKLGEIYVNDAFGCAHRNHLSITGGVILNYAERVYGYLIHKEMNALNLITQNPYKQKTMAIVGGAKMDDKLALVKNLSKKVDTIYICGGNINSILKNSMDEYMQEVQSNHARVVLMEDGLAATSLDTSVNDSSHPRVKSIDQLGESEYFYDMGPRSTITLHKLINEHSIVFWNGTIGVVEQEKYRRGSEMCVEMLNHSMRLHPAQRVIIGGGDTGGFVNKYENNFTHISTGGGASMEYITFNSLPGISIFQKNVENAG